MQTELYFLRSSEQKIASDMLYFAYRLDELGKTFQDFPELGKFTEHYGLTSRDLGIYLLKGHKIAGAAWIRLLDTLPVLTIAVKPEFRGEGLGSMMLEQLLLEAAAKFEQIFVDVLKESPAVKFYERFGFTPLEGSDTKSLVDGREIFTMIKKLEYKEIVRPSDGYDASKWMD
ncbi:GNAT family N-acetyltransferase [Sulfurimonas sp. HSL-1716]|uniref:GNAT family N-acetyltransferase n=1 Tax=Hydrocurvibacter sulfurireducens TaxID=3131937 RepID=UPI0031F90EA6